MPNFSLEQTLLAQGYQNIAGVDEVGRGPWAGPVVACAVVLNPLQLPEGIDDSKKLSAAKRESLYETLTQTTTWALGEASVAEIDTYNIRNATFLAMQRALANLPQQTDYALVDGNALPQDIPCPAQTVIKGDGKSLSIAAASIIAKVTRDRLMGKLHEEYPHFGWHTNAGYGTKTHQEGLAQHGITPHHRTSFKPIKEHLPNA
ncbi:MAG: ribonuclease HII [Alphaproteobacteria bacterium]|nr:ribonuclease HII [Alphaproteobacteria bacterium]MDD9920343.1 ribonuclease HII [Alphaproteobacteria bacterium]